MVSARAPHGWRRQVARLNEQTLGEKEIRSRLAEKPKMSRNMASRVADKRAFRCASLLNLGLAIVEAALALDAEWRLGLGRKATVADRLLALSAEPVLVAVEGG